ncbi:MULTISPECIES: RICIN domain-containing protein [unclassified Streptomyces]|uniref:RICIN domain-containing protein n=1 Tax=unclassified Streptomyces TaxID=2593676 RepID=UPI003656C8F7
MTQLFRCNIVGGSELRMTSRIVAVAASAAALVLTVPGVGHAGPPASGEYLIINGSGKCLEIENSSTANGANAQQWMCVGQRGAAWRFVDLGNWTYGIVSAKSGKCLEVENGSKVNGAQVQQWDCNLNLGHHRWEYRGLDATHYTFRNVGTGKTLEVENSSGADGARVQQWTEAWPTVRAQVWSTRAL